MSHADRDKAKHRSKHETSVRSADERTGPTWLVFDAFSDPLESAVRSADQTLIRKCYIGLNFGNYKQT